MSGYLINPRGVWEDPIFADERFSEREAYLYLREKANFADGVKRHKSTLIEIKRGQYPGTILGLAKRFKWSRVKVRAFLDIMEKGGILRHTTDTGLTIITVCNYASFDDEKKSERHSADTQPITGATPERHTINKETKETKKLKREDAPVVAPPAPHWLDAQSWQRYVDHRLSMKGEPVTTQALEAALAKLETALGKGHDPTKIINETILNGWKGLFPKEETRSAPTATRQKSNVITV